MSNKMLADNGLKKLLLYYSISGLLFVAVICGIITARKYAESLSATLSALQKARWNLTRLQTDIKDINRSLLEIKSMAGRETGADTPEVLILTRLDDLKVRIKGSEISIGDIEYKGDEISLSVNIKSEITSYADFVNTIGYLQSLEFPFLSINSVSLSQNRERTAVLYEIKGILRMPKN